MRLLRRPLSLVLALITLLSPGCAYAITMDLRRNTSQHSSVSADLYCHSLVDSLSGGLHFASDCMSEHHLKLQKGGRVCRAIDVAELLAAFCCVVPVLAWNTSQKRYWKG